jgi:hypothetical protein
MRKREALILILLMILAITVSCTRERKQSGREYYNPPPDISSQSKNEYATNGVVVGVVCSREVNNLVNEDTWDDFTSCVDKHLKEMGYEITSKNILKLDGKDN